MWLLAAHISMDLFAKCMENTEKFLEMGTMQLGKQMVMNGMRSQVALALRGLTLTEMLKKKEEVLIKMT